MGKGHFFGRKAIIIALILVIVKKEAGRALRPPYVRTGFDLLWNRIFVPDSALCRTDYCAGFGALPEPAFMPV
jgi:hypothetical protein